MKPLSLYLTVAVISTMLILSSCGKEPTCVGCQTNTPVTYPNKPPIAAAGYDQIVDITTDTVLLDGSASKDDWYIDNFQWAKVSGPSAIIIVNSNSAKAKATNLVEGIYQFELTVTDGRGAIAKDTIAVTVKKLFTNEILFTNQVWEIDGYENYNWESIVIWNIHAQLPAGIPFKVLIKRDQSNTWVEIKNNPGDEYSFAIVNNNLTIHAMYILPAMPVNDTPDIKIVY